MATKNVKLTITTQGGDINFIVRGNPASYADLAAVTNSGFEAAEATAEDNALTLGVITPTVALLASGAFERVDLSSANGSQSRTAIVPSGAVSVIKNAVQADGGLSVGGVLCTSLSSGLRRAPR